MYQSIDDPQDEAGASEGAGKSALIWLVAIIGIAAIFMVVYFYAPRSTLTEPVNEALLAEQATYRKAIAETTAPMRRARLQDFLTTYPESGYIPVAEAQLDVINAREEQSWRSATEAIFDGKMTREEKLAALERFESDWGGSLLGGRGDDITQLRAEIMDTTELPDVPDRKLKEGPSPIPKNVPDSELVGGPRPVAVPAPFLPPLPDENGTVETVQQDVIPPRIRRNRTPRYPRRARNKGIEAVVTLKLNIDAKGKVALTELVSVEAEGYERDFIKAAEYAAMRTRFHPQTVDGKPTPAVGVQKRYRFRMGN